jgi:hypothetical protein
MIGASAPDVNGFARRTKADIVKAVAKPPRVDVLAHNIPAAIRGERRSCCWRWKWDETRGKWDKPPINPRTGGGASSTDPTTWVTLAKALGFVREGNADGAGFFLGDGWAGIDLDDCMDPDGDAIDPWASEFVRRADSYTGRSPTRTGCKILLLAKLPPGRRNMGQVEFYDTGRYFTLTGHRIGGVPAGPQERQAVVEELHTEQVALYEARQAKNRRQDRPRVAAADPWRDDQGATPLDRVLARLEGVTPTAEGQFMARCPAHHDRKPSLSVGVGKGGKVLVKCFAGCPAERIVEALGMKMCDLFPPSADGLSGHDDDGRRKETREPKGQEYPKAQEALAVLDAWMARVHQGVRAGKWSYHQADGRRVALVVRYDLPTPDGEKQRKTFRPVSRCADGWRLCDPPGMWPLYRLVEIQDAERVYLTEGEKAADALLKLGLPATTSAHGAVSPGKTDWTPLLGKVVILVPDHDEAGRAYATQVVRILRRLADADGRKESDAACVEDP